LLQLITINLLLSTYYYPPGTERLRSDPGTIRLSKSKKEGTGPSPTEDRSGGGFQPPKQGRRAQVPPLRRRRAQVPPLRRIVVAAASSRRSREGGHRSLPCARTQAGKSALRRR